MAAVGSFSGLPKTEWLNVPADDARDMKLLEDFVYTDSTGKKWDAPAGSIINGASIPQWLWDSIGSPYTGCYRNASIVHDLACVRATNKAERKAADKMFWEACVTGGCTEAQANDLYMGVRIGAWWSPPTARGVRAMLPAREIKRQAVDSKKAYAAVSKKLGKNLATASLAEIDRAIEAELSSAATRSLPQATPKKKKVAKAASSPAKPKKSSKKSTK